MLKDITLGQYYPADSFIHRLDPRTKLSATLIFVISLFFFQNILGFVLVTAFLVVFIKASRVPFRYMSRGLRGVIVLFLITAVFNLFLTPGLPIEQLMFFKIHVFGRDIWFFKITYPGIKNTAFMTVRLIYLILGTTVVTLTTTPNHLTDGMETALAPLAKLKIPVHEIAMMMSIALRFIPILIEETDKIMKAQMARGADFESGGLIKKVSNMLPLLIPLFVSAFRRSYDLGMAMEARCYHGGRGRTKMNPLKYTRMDGMVYAGLFLYIAAVFLVRRYAAF